MKLGRHLIETFRRFTLAASMDEYDLASVLTKEIPELTDICVTIRPTHLHLQAVVPLTRYGLKRDLPVELTLQLRVVDKRTITFEVFDVCPHDTESFNETYLIRPPYLRYANRLLTVDLSFYFPFRHAHYRSIRHVKLEEGFLLAYLSH
ncbi:MULTISPECIES: hypothetical protein [unclassified Exiguobacterium]|uniref:hypothetical protein n=1 Tax=unclassified Exiguobacterium TaxID=2644629 RepID=UPI0025B86CED|nr:MULTISPECIES: hypothetical protein [unclassified Exiguobacterium]